MEPETMEAVNDKLIEGLEEYKTKVAKLEDKLEAREVTIEKLMAMKTASSDKFNIVNNWTDMTASDIPPKQIKVGDYYYAFVEGNDLSKVKTKEWDMSYEENDICLWIQTEDVVWIEVSDLTELKVWEYQEIKSYAIAVGMIEEDEDLMI